jgi:membrane associated rhomboid family serine protease
VLIPLRHENMQGRRWPVITFGIILLNVMIFLGTHWTIDRQSPELGEVKTHVVLLSAMHPELKLHGKAQQFVNTIQTKNPQLWKQAQQPNRDIRDGWDAQVRLQDDPDELQQEMDTLCNRFDSLDSVSIVSKFAFVPSHQTALTLISANFLHGGWLHLIGNMWFLWLAGAALEDAWGRLIYPAFYMIAGVLALQVHAMVNSGSVVPTLGASGAIAGLMGAFLVRFPKTKIEMGWLFGFRFYRFKMAAYWLLPLWLATEIFYGSLFGQLSGVAHWAHIGGFVFGGLIAVGLQASGLENLADKRIQDKISWVSEPLLVQAGEEVDKQSLDAAITTLKTLLLQKPECIDAYRMLQNIYWRKGDLTSRQTTLEKLIALELKANDPGVRETFQDFKNLGGAKLAAPLWLDLCRHLETQPDQEQAAAEYQELAQAYPSDKQGLLAQVATARICLKRLNRPAEALRLYEAALQSPVPHGDWQATIDRGIAEAKKALQLQASPAPVV